MPKLAAALTILLVTGCNSPRESASAIPERFTYLESSLESTEGRIKLAVLNHLSEEMLKNSSMVRFVPLTDEEIRLVQGEYSHKLRVATRAEYRRKVGLLDKITNEHGTLLIVGSVQIDGTRAVADGGYIYHGKVTYTFHLTNEGGRWVVHEVGSKTVSGP